MQKVMLLGSKKRGPVYILHVICFMLYVIRDTLCCSPQQLDHIPVRVARTAGMN